MDVRADKCGGLLVDKRRRGREGKIDVEADDCGLRLVER